MTLDLTDTFSQGTSATRGSARTDAEVRAAQRALAGLALTHPDLGCVEAREAELEEVLRALGICRRVDDAVDAVNDARHRRNGAPPPACGGDRGTERGYRRHQAAYSTPCAECAAAGTRARGERWIRLGVAADAEVVTAWGDRSTPEKVSTR